MAVGRWNDGEGEVQSIGQLFDQFEYEARVADDFAILITLVDLPRRKLYIQELFMTPLVRNAPVGTGTNLE